MWLQTIIFTSDWDSSWDLRKMSLRLSVYLLSTRFSSNPNLNFPPKINFLPKLTQTCRRTWSVVPNCFVRKSRTFRQLPTNQPHDVQKKIESTSCDGPLFKGDDRLKFIRAHSGTVNVGSEIGRIPLNSQRPCGLGRICAYVDLKIFVWIQTGRNKPLRSLSLSDDEDGRVTLSSVSSRCQTTPLHQSLVHQADIQMMKVPILATELVSFCQKCLIALQ